MKRLILILGIVSIGCSVPAAIGGRSTAQLSTPGITALHTLEVVKVLDIIRDTAIDSEAAKIISTSTATKVITWHRATLETIKDLPNGWKDTVLSGLDNVKGILSPSELKIIGPYINSAASVIKAVIQ